MSVIGICKLCNNKKKLIRKSHIIPNFMYDGLFDDSRKMFLADLKNLHNQPQVAQTGFFEKYILCEKCEGLFSKNERYIANLFKGPIKNPLSFEKRQSQDGLRSINIKGIDYDKFKLCFLSILWRAHISQIKFFKRIDISENEEEIRQFLIDSKPPEENIYKIGMIGIQNNWNETIRLIVDPDIVTIGVGKVSLFFINGYFYFIDLNPESNFSMFEKVYLKKSGELEVPLLNGETAIRFLISFGINENIAKNYIQIFRQNDILNE